MNLMPSILISLKMLSDPTRVRILRLLGEESLSVAELQEVLGMGQSRISTQLSLLKKAGLVSDQRSGKNNFYWAVVPGELTGVLKEAAGELPESGRDVRELRFVLRKRKDSARAYFDQLAGKFGKEYVPGRSWKSLAEGLLQCLNYEIVADLGAGEGTLAQLLAQLLAQRAGRVIAVDNSQKMVEFGEALAVKHGLENLEFRLGEIEDPPIEDGSVDLALYSQALHHAVSPRRALREAARILKPGGRVLVLDLVQHSFEKARELYYDVWLGFSEGELAEYLEECGFGGVTTAVVDRESEAPHFQTLLATGILVK